MKKLAQLNKIFNIKKIVTYKYGEIYEQYKIEQTRVPDFAITKPRHSFLSVHVSYGLCF